MTEKMKASVRAAGIKSVGNGRGGLGASEAHGKRLDAASQSRIITERNSLNWSKAGEGLDLVEAFKAHKRETAAKERNNCEIGTHLLVTISPEWLAETGDVHDPNNPRINALIKEANAWVESWQGKGSVFAWRFDLDEKGSGVVDLFTAPVREQGRRGGKRVNTIAPSQAKDELTKATGEKTSGSAFQTSWADWAQQRLDPRFERGKRKKETGREHVHAEVYAKEAAKAREKAQELAEGIRMEEERLKAARAATAAAEADLVAAKAEIEQTRSKALKIAEENRKQREKKLTLFNRTEIIQDELKKQELISASLSRESEENTKLKWKLQEELRQAQEHHNYERALRNREVDAINEYPALKIENQSLKKQIEKLKTTKSPEHLQLEEDHQNLESELHETKKSLRSLQSIFDFFKQKFKSLFPSQFEEVDAVVNAEWETHPDNPDRKTEEPEEPAAPEPKNEPTMQI